jgi:hypothetical protein
MKQNVIDFPSDTYPAGFWRWLAENEHIYDAFKIEAIRMALTGRERYSARTIVELLRWQSDLKDSDVTFKINGNYVPGMARLFMSEFGHKFPKFFALRDSLGHDE